jgi:hypothetical protein
MISTGLSIGNAIDRMTLTKLNAILQNTELPIQEAAIVRVDISRNEASTPVHRQANTHQIKLSAWWEVV